MKKYMTNIINNHLLFYRFIFVIAVVVIYACMPISQTYWEPSAKGGKLLNNTRGTVGYKDMIEFSFNEVKVRFASDGTWWSMKLIIPEGKSACFITDTIKLYDDRPSPTIIKFKMIKWENKTSDMAPTDVMRGGNTNILIGEPIPKVFSSKVDLRGVNLICYAIKPPSIKIGDQIYEIPLIKFTRKEGFGFGPIN